MGKLFKEFREITEKIEFGKDLKEIARRMSEFQFSLEYENKKLKETIEDVTEKYETLLSSYEYLLKEKDELHDTIFEIREHLKTLKPTLSKLQVGILDMLKNGKTFNEIAHKCNVTSANVNYHKKKFIKLGIL